MSLSLSDDFKPERLGLYLVGWWVGGLVVCGIVALELQYRLHINKTVFGFGCYLLSDS